MQNLPSISPEELKEKLDNGEDIFILDVREQAEFDICHLNSHLIPLNQLPIRISELNSKQNIVVYCHTGIRSANAVQFLRQAGFEQVKNLLGGIEAWANRIDKDMPRY